MPRVSAPGRYAGSPLALDFSEDNHAKSVAHREIGRDVTDVREVALTAGRRLARIRGPLEDLPRLAAAHDGAYLLCEVELDRVALDLVREVRELLPDALRVEPRYAEGLGAADETGAADGGEPRTLPEHYAGLARRLGAPVGPASGRGVRGGPGGRRALALRAPGAASRAAPLRPSAPTTRRRSTGVATGSW